MRGGDAGGAKEARSRSSTRRLTSAPSSTAGSSGRSIVNGHACGSHMVRVRADIAANTIYSGWQLCEFQKSHKPNADLA